MELREVRFKRRLSQWELSLQSGVHQSRISLIENGHPAKKDEKEKICRAIKIELDKIEWPQ